MRIQAGSVGFMEMAIKKLVKGIVNRVDRTARSARKNP
jgi:hypothetical protein